MAMDTSLGLRIDANNRQWNGKNSPQGDRQSRREQKLHVLLQCLKVGDLEGSRQAFIALINTDSSVSNDPYLSKIGSALQSSNVLEAQKVALELQRHGGKLQSHVTSPFAKPELQAQGRPDPYSGVFRIDLSA
jgi:hypothetical protein